VRAPVPRKSPHLRLHLGSDSPLALKFEMTAEKHSILQFAWQIVALTLVLSIFLFRDKRDKSGRKYVFPPGPKGLPIVGNTWDLPAFGASALAKKWAKQYGEMYHHSI
jgi:hypothetical protein